MYCPNCGTNTSLEQKFCRACGMDLQSVSQLLSGQALVTRPPASFNERAQSVFSQRQAMKRVGLLTLFGGITLAAALGVIGGALTSLDGNVGEFVASLAGLGGLGFMIGVFMLIYSLFLPKTATVAPPVQPPLVSPRARAHDALPSPPYAMPYSSVTENTTELLEREPDRPSTRQTNPQR